MQLERLRMTRERAKLYDHKSSGGDHWTRSHLSRRSFTSGPFATYHKQDIYSRVNAMPVEPSSAPPRTEDIALDPIKYPATNALDRSAPIKSSRGAGPKNGEDQVADNASSPNGEGQQTDQDDEDQGDDLDWRGTVLLAVQHASRSVCPQLGCD